MTMKMGRAALLQKCIQVIESFDPKRTTVDAHIGDTDVLKNDKNVGDVEHKFIHQVFYGCIRYQKLLKLFVTSFLYKYPAIAIRSDQTLYMILSYLLFFRLQELGVPEFRLFLNCGVGTYPALHKLLEYAFCEDDLNKWVKMEWCKLYDIKYIEEDVIGHLQSYKEEMQPLVSDLEHKATGNLSVGDGASSDSTVKKVTEPAPFNLTKPKPRLIPEPEVINRQIKAQPVPEVIHKVSLGKVEAEKKTRLDAEREKTKEKYAGEVEFNFETAKRPGVDRKEELARQIEEERYKEHTFQPEKAKPYKPPVEDAEVRQTTAAVLREEALVRKKQAQEYQVLKRYEEDLRDASEYYRWQQQKREEDQLVEELQIQERKAEMQLAREQAMEAHGAMERKNHILADHQREELKFQLDVVEHEAHVLLQKKQDLVAMTIEERDEARKAEEAKLREKAYRADQMRKDKEADVERRKKEDEQEMERKKDLIAQIRAVEKVPVDRRGTYDPSEPPNQGYMEEMSLAELQERLKIAKAHAAVELEDKRERQLEKKFEKQQELAEKVENLQKIRQVASQQASERHRKIQEKKKEEEQRKERYREQCVLEASERIANKKQKKREEEIRLKKELKEISIKRQFLQANAEMVEAKAHGEQQLGLEREARDRQKTLLLEQKKRNDIKNRESQIRRDNRQKDADDYRAMQGAVSERLLRAKAEDAMLKEDIKRAHSEARVTQYRIEERTRRDIGWSSNKYSTHKATSEAMRTSSQSA